MIIYREDLNLECLCQMGLVMRDDGQGLDEYDVVTIMIMFDIDCDNDTIRRLYKAGPFC